MSQLKLLLHCYLQYGMTQGNHKAQRLFRGFMQTFGVTDFWEKKYRELLEQETSWLAIRERAFCAVSTRPIARTFKKKSSGANTTQAEFHTASDNFLFHDFSNREQVVKAFVATGEATAKGFLKGIDVVDAGRSEANANWRQPFTLLGSSRSSASESVSATVLGQVNLPKTFCDGGSAFAFPLLPGSSPTTLSGEKTRLVERTIRTHVPKDNEKAAKGCSAGCAKLCWSGDKSRRGDSASDDKSSGQGSASGVPEDDSRNAHAPALGDKSRNGFIYYHTFFNEHMADCFFLTAASVERLFKKGVDTTIECLMNPDLMAPASSTTSKTSSEKVFILLPGSHHAPNLERMGFKALSRGAFVSLQRAEVFEVG